MIATRPVNRKNRKRTSYLSKASDVHPWDYRPYF
jgi:hypothetical protein